MKLYIGADHNGYDLKGNLIAWLDQAGFEVVDEGDNKLKTDDDFPQFAARVVNAMLASDDEDPRGILICGSGQGMCMAANRFKGIRASLCWNTDEAHTSRNDDNANVLCLPADLIKNGQAESIVRVWLNTPFSNAPRFVRRLRELDRL
ncbi:MAG TPA: RpiB/LacA/LacB family sugar-phosphate isomerase [Candidatus Binatia bacterium]|nr:RpiB/LacA/LacB family sugar-phosphate isomerase [Candidatus Binatia bacterium]